MIHPLNIFFEKIYIINLVNRPDRKTKIQERLNKLGIVAEFYTAVEYPWANQLLMYMAHNNDLRFKNAGEFSCMSSHYACIYNAKVNGYKSILILEDDTEFLKNFNDIIQSYLDALPVDYDLAYFTCNIWKMDERNDWAVEPFWRKACHCNAAAAYAVHSKFYDKILNGLDERIDIIDVFYMKLQHDTNNKMYFASPNLTRQGFSYSNLIKSETDYWHTGILSYAGKNFTDYE